MAFNAKNLSYNKSEPAFLQRMKAGYASQDGRSNVQHARSGKSRLKTGDGDEDEPLILDESGEIVRKDVYEGMLKGRPVGADEEGKDGETVEDSQRKSSKVDGREGQVSVGDGEGELEREREKQRVVDVGVAKKRKAVKVVGVSEEGDDDRNLKNSTKDTGHGLASIDTESRPTEKPKKKAKKIKLSFDNPE